MIKDRFLHFFIIQSIYTFVAGYFLTLYCRGQLNRSVLQSTQVLEETSSFRIEKFGLPLPVLITEALTYADSTFLSITFDHFLTVYRQMKH